MPEDARPPALRPLSVAAGTPSPPRHRTVLPAEEAAALRELDEALGRDDREAALRAVVSARPDLLDAWARLGQEVLARDDPVTAYACARVAYHRGLDRLRRHGWGGTGEVRWEDPTNRGFLRGLHLLLACAARLGEIEESARCRQFLLDLDPDDALGAAAIPEAPGPDWRPGSPLP